MTQMIVDTDTHAIEARDVWTARMNPKWGDDIPHIKWDPKRRSDMWYLGDTALAGAGFPAVIARDEHGEPRRNPDYPRHVTRFNDLHPSAWDPSERVKVMDKFGIRAASLYPNLGFLGPDIYHAVPDAPLSFQLEIATAYNDWILDWERTAPGRFIPHACVPYWDLPTAIGEIERCAELGHKGFVLSGSPDLHGQRFMADPYWNPMWEALQAAGLPISFHAAGGGETGEYLRSRLAVEGYNSNLVRSTASAFLRCGMTAADLIMSGVLARYPRLRFVIVESGVGWIPFLLETLDEHARRYPVRGEHPEMTELPSVYFRRQVYANVWYEKVTPAMVEAIGADNLLFETDYPHNTCLLGTEIDESIESNLGGLDETTRDAILWRNADRLFGLSASVSA
jgi:predicted TIM-barrel fold metal-dependent hydrolase